MALLFEETWDARTCQWISSLPTGCIEVNTGVLQIDTNFKFSGAGSLRYFYGNGVCRPSSPNFGGTDCGGFADRFHTGTASIFRRFRFFVPNNFVQETLAPTKLLSQSTLTGYSSWLTFATDGTLKLMMVGQGANGVTTNFLSSIAVPRNTWNCIETGEVLSTPGVANGTIQIWVNGVQSLNVVNYMNRLSGDTAIFTDQRVFRQHGEGDLWFDNLAVGTTRFNDCGGAPPPPDTTPPAVPTGLAVS